MRYFGTQGRVRSEQHYVVPRTEEVNDFINRVKAGKYIVLFAPRQTGKTTFFRLALDALTAEDPTYFPIQLDFQTMRNAAPVTFYEQLYYMIQRQIKSVFQKRGGAPSDALTQFLENTTLTDHFSMEEFFENFGSFLDSDCHKDVPAFKKVVLLIDEFDGIPKTVISDFLYSLRQIYLSEEMQCPHSVGIVGVKSIAQLDYDRSVSPFNIQDEFRLPNFTLEQVHELFQQYTDEVGQSFAPEVLESIYKQTAGQPFLVNRFGQILTEEFNIPKTDPISTMHWATAHAQLLQEQNTNITHLTTNIRRDPRFETMLMRIMARDESVEFNLHNDIINELATYGVIAKGSDGMCEIVNPIYLYCILQTFKPVVNGLEDEYFLEDIEDPFSEYLTSTGEIALEALLDNFQDFIRRVGFRILQVPGTPRESVGRHLLLAYLDQFVKLVGGVMHIEVQTGRGRMDLIVNHNQRKYIVETKVWRGNNRYQAGKRQLAAYLKLENVMEGYYVVFDHRREPEPRVETETVEGVKIRSYVIPVIQEQPSAQFNLPYENP
ncbi:MAG: AAA-like domain-containing protein [Candidatus Poribacteria bacterium]|nr:AAA-like domain-containing protein [Candidatus Poribacteria bacterium]